MAQAMASRIIATKPSIFTKISRHPNWPMPIAIGRCCVRIVSVAFVGHHAIGYWNSASRDSKLATFWMRRIAVADIYRCGETRNDEPKFCFVFIINLFQIVDGNAKTDVSNRREPGKFCGESEQPQTFISETSYVKVTFYAENFTDQVIEQYFNLTTYSQLNRSLA